MSIIKPTYTHEEYAALQVECNGVRVNLCQAEETIISLKNTVKRLQSEIDILYENKRLVTELESIKLEKLSAAQAESDKIRKAELAFLINKQTDLNATITSLQDSLGKNMYDLSRKE